MLLQFDKPSFEFSQILLFLLKIKIISMGGRCGKFDDAHEEEIVVYVFGVDAVESWLEDLVIIEWSFGNYVEDLELVELARIEFVLLAVIEAFVGEFEESLEIPLAMRFQMFVHFDIGETIISLKRLRLQILHLQIAINHPYFIFRDNDRWNRPTKSQSAHIESCFVVFLIKNKNEECLALFFFIFVLLPYNTCQGVSVSDIFDDISANYLLDD